jgi:VWFA-related protein
MMRRALVTAAALGAAITGVAAQQPTPTLRASVDQVVVDVIVTDGNGAQVTGLTAADFEITERGKAQTIATFTEVTLPPARSVAAGGTASATTTLPPSDVRSNRDTAAGRVYLLALDDLFVDLVRTGNVRQGAHEFVNRYVQPGDVVAVWQTSGAGFAQDFTSDMSRVHAAIDTFMGKKGLSPVVSSMQAATRRRQQDPLNSPSSGTFTLEISQEQRFFAQDMLKSLVNAAAVLETVPGRRKALLLFSEGIPIPFETPAGQQLTSSIDEVWTAAARANVTIYPIDPRGLHAMGDELMAMSTPPTQEIISAINRERRVAADVLRTLAEGTGGIAGVETNSPERTFARIDADSRHYYLLGYVPKDASRDGRYRSLSVKVKRPGVEVSARKGYTAPNDAPPPRKAVERFADATLSPELVALLARPVPAGGLTFTAAAAALPGAETNVRVVIEIAPGALASAGPADTALEIALLGVDAAGKTSRVRKGKATIAAADAAAIAGTGLRIVDQLTLAPGRHQVRVALRETGRGTSGLVICDVEIPPAGRGLTLSDVVLGAASAMGTPSLNQDERLSAGLGDVPPTTARAFAPGDELYAFVEVQANGPGGGTAVVRASVRDGQGHETPGSSETLTLVAGQPARHSIPLQLDGRFPPGPYVLRFEARADPASAPVVREIGFEVGAAAR